MMTQNHALDDRVMEKRAKVKQGEEGLSQFGLLEQRVRVCPVLVYLPKVNGAIRRWNAELALYTKY